jgi:hypothetical protein
MEKKPEYNLNPKHQKMFDVIAKAGPMGVNADDFFRKFFKPTNSPVTLRTAIMRMNDKLHPLQVVMRFGTLRLK